MRSSADHPFARVYLQLVTVADHPIEEDAMSIRLFQYALSPIVVLLMLGCVSQQDIKLSARHEVSGKNTRFDFKGDGFAEYLAHTRRMIESARASAGWKTGPSAIEMILPFQCSPDKPGICAASAGREYSPAYGGFREDGGRYINGILLIHGVTDSPYLMRDLARYFSGRRGFLVRAILSPGHGTVPGDLLEVTHEDWTGAVQFGIRSFEGLVRNLYIAGYSNGGALAIQAALEGAPVKGLFLFSPVIEVTSLARFANLHKVYSWAFPRGKWASIHRDRDQVKYESFANNAGYQVHLLSNRNREKWEKTPLKVPMFIAQSKNDTTVHSSAVKEFFDAHDNPDNRMIWYTESESGGGNGKRIRKAAASDFSGRDGNGAILGFSHIALPNHPLNPHYGINGRYRSCLHYVGGGEQETGKLAICKNDNLFEADARAAYGEKDQVSGGNIVRRLTYNPHFEGMTREMDAFLDRLR